MERSGKPRVSTGYERARIEHLVRQLDRVEKRVTRMIDPAFGRELRDLRGLAGRTWGSTENGERRKLIIGLETALAELQSLELEGQT